MLQTALVAKRHDERAGRREVRYLRHILYLEMATVSGALSLARTLLAAVGGPPPCVAASATGGAWKRALASCARGLYMQLVAVRYGRVMNVVELMDAAGPAQQSLLANALHDFSLLAGALLSLAAQLLADAPGSEVLAEALPEAGLPWRGLLAAPDVGRVHSTADMLLTWAAQATTYAYGLATSHRGPEVELRVSQQQLVELWDGLLRLLSTAVRQGLR